MNVEMGPPADERHFIGIVHQGGADLADEVLGAAYAPGRNRKPALVFANAASSSP